MQRPRQMTETKKREMKEMGFFTRVFGKTSKNEGPSTLDTPAETALDLGRIVQSDNLPSPLVRAAMADPVNGEQKSPDTVAVAEETEPPVVNIWDLADEDEALAKDTTIAPRRRRRNQTRVLDFNGEDLAAGTGAASTVDQKGAVNFPVGLILISEGPGRGACLLLESGMSQIGRGDDQTVQLDFGDASISRNNHAAIVYDPETHEFTLGHGGKQNIVRLNGKPLVSSEPLSSGDTIKLGETTLRFQALCSAEFNWSDTPDDKENDHVAIA